MINVRRLTVITLCVTGSSISGNILRAQDNPAMDISVTPATEQTVENDSDEDNFLLVHMVYIIIYYLLFFLYR